MFNEMCDMLSSCKLLNVCLEKLEFCKHSNVVGLVISMVLVSVIVYKHFLISG